MWHNHYKQKKGKGLKLLQQAEQNKAISKNMTRLIVTAAEKKANATRYCTSPRPQRSAARKAARERDFASLVKSCIKVGMSKPRAIEHANAVMHANVDLYTEGGSPRLWGYSPTSPRPFAEL